MTTLRPLPALALLGALLVLAALGSLLVGSGPLAAEAVRELRWLRTGAAALAGAALAVGGALLQGLFRNPLASPSVLGTTAGSALGGQIVLLSIGLAGAALPAWLDGELLMPLGCLAGALLALGALLAIEGRSGSLVTLLLGGFLIGALATSIGAFLTVLAQDSWQLGRAMVAFTLGGVDGKGPRHLLLAAPLVAAGIAAAWWWGRALDCLLAGEDEAAALGVDVRQARRWALVWTAALTAAATLLGGGVAFVGLVVPNALRPLVGVAHRALIPACALGGAAFLVACDVAARGIPLLLQPLVPRQLGEIPLGVVSGLVGAPVFLVLLLRLRRAGELA